MPIATVASELTGGFEQPFSQAGKVQINSFIGMPVGAASVAAGATAIPGTSPAYTSPLLFADGYQVITIALTMAAAGTLVITRYLDAAGTMARPASTTSIVSATALIVDITDDLPFLTFQFVINNTGSATFLSAFAFIMNAD